MRYILNGDYIDAIIFIAPGGTLECKDMTCTEYTGAIPEGYSSLEEWHTIEDSNERLNAWKIVDGNLVFDEDKFNELQAIYEEESSTGGIVKITLPTDLANLSTSYNYFHPFAYSDNDVLTEGKKLTYGSMVADYGDRTGATVYGVTVGKDVSYVKATYNIRILNNSTSKLVFTTDIGRVRNGELTVFGGTSDTLQPEARHTTSAVVTQIPVEEGDFLFVYGYKGSKTADVDVVSAWGMTNATFEVASIERTMVINNTGGGSGGTDDYESLNNLPRINGTKVTGNKTLEEYGIQPAGNYALKTDVPDVTGFATSEEVGIISSNINDRVDIINDAVNQNIDDISTINGTLENKVDKVSGKGLSTNDFTNTYKSNVDSNTSARHTHSNKTVLDGITSAKVSEWNNKLSSVPSEYVTDSELKAKGYLTSFTESDPTVPSHVKNITSANITSWNNKSDFSGSYNDLTNKPTIPTVPTNISAFTNDSGYITANDIPDGIEELTSNFNVWELESGIYYVAPGVTMTNYTMFYDSLTSLGVSAETSMASITIQLAKALLIVHNYYEGMGMVEFNLFMMGEAPVVISGMTMYQDTITMGGTVTGGNFMLFSKLQNYQEKLVSGTNIKTINGETLLGSGNITIEGGSSGSGIETLSGSARLWNLSQGVYLIAPSTVIQYYGATGSSSFTLSGGGVLSISDGNGSYKGFQIVTGEGAEAYIYLGATSSTYGFYAKLSRVNLQNAKACTYASSQNAVGYYNATSNVSSLNTTMYLQPNEWSIVISASTTGAPNGITNSTKVYVSVKAPGFSGSGISASLMPYIRQDMYAPSLNKHWYRIVNLISNSDITYGEWIEIKETVDCTVYNVTGDATSVSSATNKTIATLKIPSGTYIVNAHVSFAANTTGVRKIYIGTTQDSYANTRALADTRPASNHQATMSNISTILDVEEETTYYLNVYQNSGSTLSCSGSLRAVRLGASTPYQPSL